jgi:hypothetical protein
MNAQHLSIDELAEAAEGLLNPDRAALPSRILPIVRTVMLSRRLCGRSRRRYTPRPHRSCRMRSPIA